MIEPKDFNEATNLLRSARQELEISAWAARCIRKYQRTGIVDWAGTRK